MNLDGLTFISGNQFKVQQLSHHLGTIIPHKKLDLPEIQSLDLKEIVKSKVKEAYKIIKRPVLVDDISLIFNELNELPGPLIKWFLLSLGNEKLCRMLDGKKRDAIAKVCFGLYDGNEIKFFEGEKKGTIAHNPAGEGWGWNLIFIPDGEIHTYAQILSGEHANGSALRSKPLKELKLFLDENNYGK